VAFHKRDYRAVNRIIFVTGTDTGVGKTVLTALLVAHLRKQGRDALAMKPFCSGSRRDARLLRSLQPGCLTLDEVNPFYFDKPLAPAAAAKPVPLGEALARIRALARRCEVLLVEGAGGLLSPLGSDYCARDLIRALSCRTIIVGRNRLGIINHTLLTAEAMQDVAIEKLAIVLMGVKNPDLSASSNEKMLRKGNARGGMPLPLFSIPYLGKRASTAGVVKKNVTFLKKVLARFT
jgi:dethiobiotin synthetase